MSIVAASRAPAWLATHERVRVWVFCSVVFLYWAAMYTYVPILPGYARSMGASLGTVGLLVGVYGLGQMLLRVPIGILSDRWGRRRPFISAGFVAAGVGALGLSLAPSPEMLIVFRGLVGVAAATWVASTVLFAGYFEADGATRAVGLLSFVTGVAQLVATGLGGRLAEQYGTSWAFLAGAGLAAFGLLGTFAIPEHHANRAPPSLWQLAAIATVPSLLAVSAVAAVVQYASWATTYAFVPLYAEALGASPTTLGLLTSASVVLYTVANLAVAGLVVRVGARNVTIGGLTLMALSVVVVPYLTSLWALAVWQALGGVGRALAFTALMGESIRGIAPRERATAMGVFQAVYAIGMFVGPASAGLLAERAGLAGAFWLSGALLLLGVLLSARVVSPEVSTRNG